MKCSVKEIAKLIEPLRKVVLVCHFDPDGDAYGAMLGLKACLEKRGVAVTCVNQSKLIDRFRCFPGVLSVQNTIPEPDGYDAVIVVDCGALVRVGEQIIPGLKKFKQIINIDHHFANDEFGTHNWVSVESSSASEMILEVALESGWQIPKEAAWCFMAGLMWDTGSFSYSCTSKRTFELAAMLRGYGIAPNEVSTELFESTPMQTVKLQADALTHMEVYESGKVAVIVVPKELYQKYQAEKDASEGLAEQARRTKGVAVSVMMRQEDDFWKVSLRSKFHAVDVQKIASSFGGGGHKMAAAMRFKRKLPEFKEQVISSVCQAVSQAGV
jgi:phosphoesterase RecJ-like protein